MRLFRQLLSEKLLLAWLQRSLAKRGPVSGRFAFSEVELTERTTMRVILRRQQYAAEFY